MRWDQIVCGSPHTGLRSTALCRAATLRRQRTAPASRAYRTRRRFGDAAGSKSATALSKTPWSCAASGTAAGGQRSPASTSFPQITEISVLVDVPRKKESSTRAGTRGRFHQDLRPRDRLEPSGDAAASTSSPFSRRITSRSRPVLPSGTERSSVQRTFPVRSSIARKLCPNSCRHWKPYKDPVAMNAGPRSGSIARHPTSTAGVSVEPSSRRTPAQGRNCLDQKNQIADHDGRGGVHRRGDCARHGRLNRIAHVAESQAASPARVRNA